MGSRTLKPFTTTNLVVFAPDYGATSGRETSECIADGHVLVVDPGCCSKYHKEVCQLSSGSKH